MPSTCSCVLSRVMQICGGTSSGISRRSCLYATRSKNGQMMLSPGSSTAWKRPSRSTTHARCCGTTRIALITTIRPTRNRTNVTSEKPLSMARSLSIMKSIAVVRPRAGPA
jgi:hypothetical protein